MKVLLVSNDYPTERTKGIPSIRIQKEILESMGVEIDVYPIETGNKVSYLKAFLHFLMMNFQKKRYDIVHAYYGLSAFIAVMQYKMPVVATFLGSDILAEGHHNDRDRRFSMVAVRRAREVIVMSEEMKRCAEREDAHVIPFGVHLSDFQLEDQGQARQKIGLSPDKKYILFPWKSDRAVKRFDLVQQAMQILQTQIPEAEILVVFGKTHQEVVDYMNACDAVVLASDHEGSPVSIREALACNLPVVSVDVGDVADLLRGVENNFIVEKTPQAIAQGLTMVLQSEKRSNGREKMKSYDMIGATKRVYHLYRGIVESG